MTVEANQRRFDLVLTGRETATFEDAGSGGALAIVDSLAQSGQNSCSRRDYRGSM